jgi:hypothetical protein
MNEEECHVATVDEDWDIKFKLEKAITPLLIFNSNRKMASKRT